MIRRLIAIGLLLAAATWTAGEEKRLLKPEHFEHRATLPGPFTKDSLYRVPLTAELLSKSVLRQADIRLFDPQGNEVPYAIVENRAMGSDMYSDLAIIGPDDAGLSSTLILKVPGHCRSLDGLSITTSAQNFRKKVILAAGSEESPATWIPVAEDLIFDFSAQVDLRKTAFRFPATTARYLKLTLADPAEAAGAVNTMELRYDGLDFRVSGAAGQPFRIAGVQAISSPERKEPTVYDGKTFENPALALDKDRNTVIRLDVNLPLERVTFDVANPFFYRRVAAFGGAAADDDKQHLVGGATLYALPMAGRTDRQNMFPTQSSQYRYYRFVITNGDNPPLQVRSVTLEWIQRELYFLATSTEPAYTLFVGSDLAYSPNYELNRMVYRGSDFARRSTRLEAGPVERNPAYVPTPTTLEREKTERMVLTAVIVVLLAGMGFWLFRLLRRGFGRSDDAGSGGSQSEG